MEEPTRSLNLAESARQGPATAPSDPPALKRAVIYLRVSTVEQAQKDRDAEGYSLPAQREACHRKAKELGAEVVDEYMDRGESARTVDRPALQLMLARVTEQLDVDYVIVHKMDRLARSSLDDATITLIVTKAGGKVVSCTEQIDATASGRLLQGILASINEFYSANLAAECSKGMLQKAKKGGTPGRAAIGYRNVAEVVGNHEIRTVAIDPEAAEHVQWSFTTYANGRVSLTELTELLVERGFRSRGRGEQAGVPMSKARVHAMLRNRYYLGIVTYKGIEYPGAHPPLVDQRTFQKVQELLTERNVSGERKRLHEHYLKGTVYCADCGSRLYVSVSNRPSGSYRYFRCGRWNGPCNLPYFAVELVEQHIVDFYRRGVTLTPDVRQAIQDVAEADFKAERDSIEAEAARQEKRLVNLRLRRKRLMDGYLDGAIEKEAMVEERESLRREIETAEKAVAARSARVGDIDKVLHQVLDLAERVGSVYAVGSPQVRRRFNQAIFERIEVGIDGLVEQAEVRKPFSAVMEQEIKRRAEGTECKRSNNSLESDWTVFRSTSSRKFSVVPPP